MVIRQGKVTFPINPSHDCKRRELFVFEKKKTSSDIQMRLESPDIMTTKKMFLGETTTKKKLPPSAIYMQLLPNNIIECSEKTECIEKTECSD
jgi:hypothetical protein